MTHDLPDRAIVAAPLTPEAFAPFGQVVELPTSTGVRINRGTAERFDDVAELVLAAAGGRPQFSVFCVSPSPLPVRIREVERHTLSSQMFLPFDGRRFLVAVAPKGERVEQKDVRVFLSNGSQGVNYAPGVWHAPVIALGAETYFGVLGRKGPDVDCDLVTFETALEVMLDPVGSD
jgi:ureidoglycolate lyase